MPVKPAYPYRSTEIMLTPLSIEAFGVAGLSMAGRIDTFASAAWVNANTGVFYPFGVAEPWTVTKLYWINGGTISTPGSVDVGIFDTAGVLLTSTGSQTPSGTTQTQSVDITDYVLARGTYYMGMTASVANAANFTTLRIASTAPIWEGMGAFEQASAAPPFSTSANPAVFAVMTRAFMPWFGLQAIRAFGP